jgi:hypothetical protein
MISRFRRDVDIVAFLRYYAALGGSSVPTSIRSHHQGSRGQSLDLEFVEKIESRTVCSRICFFENRAVYEVMWNNRAQPDGPQLTV